MIFALLTLLSALSVAFVAGWFSIAGIMAIYAGAPMYALIMGVVIESAKLVTTSWLYRNWQDAGWLLKAPLIYFILALMIATSIGVFGLLSKAHIEQGAGTLDNSAKIEQLQYQINREKSTIVDNEKVTKQLDDTVNSFLGKDRADKALSVRKSQITQRKQLRDDSNEAQKRIDELSKQKFDLESEIRKLQLDVGPIRYIAELIYGAEQNADKNIESAVRIFTLLLVSTLDPLAVVLLMAANHTLLRLKDEKKDKIPAARSGFFSKFRRNSGFDTKISESVLSHGVEEYSSMPICTRNTDGSTEEGKETKMDVPVSHRVVEAVNEEIIDTKGNIACTEAPAESNTSRASISDEGNVSRTESVEALVESEANFVEVGAAGPELQTEVSSSGRVLKEDKTDDLEKFARAPVDIYPLPIIRTPNLSRIMDIEQYGTEEAIPAEVSSPKVPWAQQDNVLREIIGQVPHFSPTKLNEEEILHTLHTEGTSAATGMSPRPQPPKIKEISAKGSTHNTEESRDETIDKGNIWPSANVKYPTALSWLTEFRRE